MAKDCRPGFLLFPSKGLLVVVGLALGACGGSSGSDENPPGNNPPSVERPDPEIEVDDSRRELLLQAGENAEEERLTPKDRCAAEWSGWLQRFAATTPSEAYNNNSDWPVGTDVYASGAAGASRIQLSRLHGTGEGQGTQLLYLSDARIAADLDNRDRDIMATLQETIRETDQDTLLLVHLGTAHSIDIYFNQLMSPGPLTGLIYSQYPVREGTLLGSPGLYHFVRLLDEEVGLEDDEQVGPVDDISYVFPATFVGKFVQARESNLTLSAPNLFPGRPATGNVVFLGDTHGLNEAALASGLPTSNCLRSLGFNDVKLAIEGFHRGDDLDIPLIAKAFDLNNYYDESQRRRVKEMMPEAYELLAGGKVQFFPNMTELLVKLKQYETAGIGVSYQGFESDYDSTFYDAEGRLRPPTEDGKEDEDAVANLSASSAFGGRRSAAGHREPPNVFVQRFRRLLSTGERQF